MMKLRLFCVLFFAQFCIVGTTTCQQYPMLHYTTNDGLPSDMVYSVYRDSKDFLWIATDKGIARYNGIKFETFTTFNGLPDNEIFFFQEDKYDRLWLGTFNGRLCFYEKGVFHTAANTPFLSSAIIEPHITQIVPQKDSSIIIEYFNLFKTTVVNRDTCKSYDFSYLKNETGFYQLLCKEKVRENVFKIISDSETYYADANRKLGHISFREKKMPLFTRRYYQNRTYLVNDSGIFDENYEVVKRAAPGFLHKNGFNFYYSDPENFFICTRNGLFVNDSIHLFKGIVVSSVFQDNIGNYWVSTVSNGLYCIYKDFLETKIYADIYTEKVVYSKLIKDKLFYASSTNNLYFLHHDSVNCRFDFNKYKHANEAYTGHSAHLIDNDNKYYSFSTYDNIVIPNVLSVKAKPLRFYNLMGRLGCKMVTKVGDQIFLRTPSHILEINYTNVAVGERYNWRSVRDFSIDKRIQGSTCGPDGSYWYSSGNSLFKVQIGSGEVKEMVKNITLKDFIFSGEDIVGCTPTNELLVLSKCESDVQIDTVGKQNCIWDKMYHIDTGHIFISTNSLYWLLTIVQHDPLRYDLNAIENPFLPLQAENIYVDSNNCFFFKDGSLTRVSSAQLLQKPIIPQLSFLSVNTTFNSCITGQVVELPYYDSRNVKILFSTLSYSNRNITYQLSISKTDVDNWQELNGEEINMLQPSYGTYIIKVKAKTASSEYSKPIVLTLHILNPWWVSWWFIACCIVALLLIILLVVKLRTMYVIKQSKKKHDDELKFIKSEYKTLNALMNPHFIFNTLNNVQSLFNANDKLAANEYLRVFADLIRQNMSNVSKELITLQKEIALVMNYLMLEKLRFEDKLTYNINIDEHIDTSDILVPPLLIQPLVENSIKHGILPLKEKPGIIDINIFQQGDRILIEIKDNGVGLQAGKDRADAPHESFGMDNIRKRIEQLSIIQNKKIEFHVSEINDDEGTHRWTVITISMPITE